MKIERKYPSRTYANRVEYVIHYPSFEDLLKDAPKNDINQTRMRTAIPMTSIRGREWYGPAVRTGEEFEQKVKEGWPELLSAVKYAASHLTLNPETLPVALTQATKRRRVRADNGSDLDIHAVYQGNLDRAWSNTRRDLHQVRRKAAHVYINIGGLGSVDAMASIWRAATAYKVCDMLQKSGYTVEITVGASADQVFTTTSTVHTSFTAKSSSMPLDLNRLAMQSCMGWHRFYNFKARLCNDDGRVCQGHMGYTNSHVTSPYIKECEERGELLVVINADVLSERMAQAAIKQVQVLIERKAA